MYTYNITFVTSPVEELQLTEYLQNRVIPRLFSKDSLAINPELRKVVEIGGETPDPQHGVSIALAATFPTAEVAHLWHENFLLPALAECDQKFGQQVLHFTTLLENISV